MRKLNFTLALAVASITLAAGAIDAQPAPPPPPGFPDYVALLDKAYNDRDIAAFGALFRDDVKLFADGELVTSGKAALLKRMQSEFDANLHVSTLSWAQGSQILAMQEIRGCIPAQPNPQTLYHGCRWTRAIRYDIGDNQKITAIHILEAKQTWNVHPL